MEIDDLAAVAGPALDLADLSMLVTGVPLVVRLAGRPDPALAAAAARRLREAPTVVVLVAEPEHGDPLLDGVDLALTERASPPRPWVEADATDVTGVASRTPLRLALTSLLRTTATQPVWDAVVSESATYGMLLGGAAYGRWLDERGTRRVEARGGPSVDVSRRGERLRIELDRPEVHNALDRSIRDELVAALDLAAADPTISTVELRGRGPSFCSGGDLGEFGTVEDGATAYAVRLSRHPGLAVHRVADRTTAWLHGACVGAGIEVAAFAHRVVADPETSIRLPEVAMGLVPGAGGTVSLTRRIGRHRTAWLGLTGAALGAATASEWGLVDDVAPIGSWPD